MTHSLEEIGDHFYVVSRRGQPCAADDTRYKHYKREIRIDSANASQHLPDSLQHLSFPLPPRFLLFDDRAKWDDFMVAVTLILASTAKRKSGDYEK